MSDITCPKCNSPNPSSARFCYKCGAQLGNSQSNVGNKKNFIKQAFRIFSALLLMMVVLALIAGAVLIFQGKKLSSLTIPEIQKTTSTASLLSNSATQSAEAQNLDTAIAAPLLSTQIPTPTAVNKIQQLVYIVDLIEGDQSTLTRIIEIKENGEDIHEIYNDNNGLSSVAGFLEFFPWMIGNVFSPDGKTIVVAENDGNLLLLNRETSSVISVDTQNKGLAGFGSFQGFSPNGKYFGFTDQDNNSNITIIIDLQGNVVNRFEDAIFGAFLSDSRHIAVAKKAEISDQGGLVEIGIIDIINGEYSYIAGRDENISPLLDIFSVLKMSPKGETIFYDSTNLMQVSTLGGLPSLVSENTGFLVFSPNEMTLAILDSNEVYLYNVIQDEISFVIDHAKNLNFSSDGKYIAYVTNEGMYEDLYISKIDGSEKTQITKNANCMKFSFSPDNDYVAYVDGRIDSYGGSLHIVDRDGSDSRILDDDVWSFRFTDDGTSIVYIKVNDQDISDLQSEIFRINITGNPKDHLVQADDGVFTFIWPAP